MLLFPFGKHFQAMIKTAIALDLASGTIFSAFFFASSNPHVGRQMPRAEQSRIGRTLQQVKSGT
jgi:hypothetical protein